LSSDSRKRHYRRQGTIRQYFKTLRRDDDGRVLVREVESMDCEFVKEVSATAVLKRKMDDLEHELVSYKGVMGEYPLIVDNVVVTPQLWLLRVWGEEW
jgi:hypothetical protein